MRVLPRRPFIGRHNQRAIVDSLAPRTILALNKQIQVVTTHEDAARLPSARPWPRNCSVIIARAVTKPSSWSVQVRTEVIHTIDFIHSTGKWRGPAELSQLHQK